VSENLGGASVSENGVGRDAEPEDAQQAEIALGEQLAGQARHAEAAQAFRRALELEGEHAAAAQTALALALLDEVTFGNLGALPEAATEIRRAAEVDPGNDDVRAALGIVATLEGDPAEGARLADEVLAHDPNNILGYTGLCAALVRSGHPREAGEAAWTAREINPRAAGPHLAHAVALVTVEQFRAAEEPARRAVQITGGLGAYAILAAALSGQGRHDAAVANATTGLRYGRDTAIAHAVLAHVLFAADRDREAAEEAARVFEHGFPPNAELGWNAGYIAGWADARADGKRKPEATVSRWLHLVVSI
jgi:tetratricopeptide (TPR) repeat protein